MGEFRNIRRLGLPGGPNEVIADQMGQWSNPGQPTRIEGNEITMQGVPYPVWALPNVGAPTLMHPDQDYSFPGAEYVDELPLAQNGKEINNLEEWIKEIRSVEKEIGNPNQWTFPNYWSLQNTLNNYKHWRENTLEGQAVYDSHNEPGEYIIEMPPHLKNLIPKEVKRYGGIPLAQMNLNLDIPAPNMYTPQAESTGVANQIIQPIYEKKKRTGTMDEIIDRDKLIEKHYHEMRSKPGIFESTVNTTSDGRLKRHANLSEEDRWRLYDNIKKRNDRVKEIKSQQVTQDDFGYVNTGNLGIPVHKDDVYDFTKTSEENVAKAQTKMEQANANSKAWLDSYSGFSNRHGIGTGNLDWDLASQATRDDYFKRQEDLRKLSKEYAEAKAKGPWQTADLRARTFLGKILPGAVGDLHNIFSTAGGGWLLGEGGLGDYLSGDDKGNLWNTIKDAGLIPFNQGIDAIGKSDFFNPIYAQNLREDGFVSPEDMQLALGVAATMGTGASAVTGARSANVARNVGTGVKTFGDDLIFHPAGFSRGQKYNPFKLKPDMSMPKNTGKMVEVSARRVNPKTHLTEVYTASVPKHVMPNRTYADVKPKMKNLRKDLGIGNFEHWLSKNIKGPPSGPTLHRGSGIVYDVEGSQLYDSNTRYWLNRLYGKEVTPAEMASEQPQAIIDLSLKQGNKPKYFKQSFDPEASHPWTTKEVFPENPATFEPGLSHLTSKPKIKPKIKPAINPKPKIKPAVNPKPAFDYESQINWSNWNPEAYGKYADDINRYSKIEADAKASGTWMKNPDGSPFTGTNPTQVDLDFHGINMTPKEAIEAQFVQSIDLKNHPSYPHGYEHVFRGVGSRQSSPTLTDKYKAVFTADKSLADSYGSNLRHLIRHNNSKKALELETGHSDWTSIDLDKVGDLDKVKERLEKSIAWHDRKIKKRQDELVTKGDAPHYPKDFFNVSKAAIANLTRSRAREIKTLEGLDKMKNNPEEFEKLKEHWKNPTASLSNPINPSTDDIAKYLEGSDLDYIKLNNIIDGGRGDVTIAKHDEGHYLKSALGNVGFDPHDAHILHAEKPPEGGFDFEFMGDLNKHLAAGKVTAEPLPSIVKAHENWIKTFSSPKTIERFENLGLTKKEAGELVKRKPDLEFTHGGGSNFDRTKRLGSIHNNGRITIDVDQLDKLQFKHGMSPEAAYKHEIRHAFTKYADDLKYDKLVDDSLKKYKKAHDNYLEKKGIFDNSKVGKKYIEDYKKWTDSRPTGHDDSSTVLWEKRKPVEPKGFPKPPDRKSFDVGPKTDRYVQMSGTNAQWSPETIIDQELATINPRFQQGDLSKEAKIIEDDYMRMLKEKHGLEDADIKELRDLGQENFKYFHEANEKYPHIVEMRVDMLERGVIKDAEVAISKAQIKEYMDVNPWNRIASFTPATEKNMKLLHKWINGAPIITGALGLSGAGAALSEKRFGGSSSYDGYGKMNKDMFKSNPSGLKPSVTAWGKFNNEQGNIGLMGGVNSPHLSVFGMGLRPISPEDQKHFPGLITGNVQGKFDLGKFGEFSAGLSGTALPGMQGAPWNFQPGVALGYKKRFQEGGFSDDLQSFQFHGEVGRLQPPGQISDTNADSNIPININQVRNIERKIKPINQDEQDVIDLIKETEEQNRLDTSQRLKDTAARVKENLKKTMIQNKIEEGLNTRPFNRPDIEDKAYGLISEKTKREQEEKKLKMTEEAENQKGFAAYNAIQPYLILRGDVTALQKELKADGFNLGKYGKNQDGIDGKWGLKTEKAYNQVLKNKSLDISIVDEYRNKYKTLGPQEEVKSIQKDLIKKGFLPAGADDGKFGDDTTQAIMTYNNSFVPPVEDIKGDIMSLKLPESNWNIASPTEISSRNPSGVVKDCAKGVCKMLEMNNVEAEALGVKHVDAWGMFKNMEEAGNSEEIFNIYKDPESWRDLGSAALALKTIQEIDKNDSTIKNPASYKVGDVVGLFFPTSTHHGETNYAIIDPGGYRDDKDAYRQPTNTRNTHVGIVSHIIDGMPYISHNISGTVHVDPVGDMKLGFGTIPVWLRRPTLNSTKNKLINYKPDSKKYLNSDDITKPIDDYTVNLIVDNIENKAETEFSKADKNSLNKRVQRVMVGSQQIPDEVGIDLTTREKQWLQSAALGILGVESRIGTRSIHGGTAKGAAKDLVHWWKNTPEGEKSKGIGKIKFSKAVDKFSRDYFNVNSSGDLNDANKTIDVTIYNLAKRYESLKAYAEQFPELDLQPEDIRNLAILGHNEGYGGSSQTRFGRYKNKDGTINPKTAKEELHSMRKNYNMGAKVKDISSTDWRHIPEGIPLAPGVSSGNLRDALYESNNPEGAETYISKVKRYQNEVYGSLVSGIQGREYDVINRRFIDKESSDYDFTQMSSDQNKYRHGGSVENGALSLYKRYMEGGENNESGKRVYDKLNRVFYNDAKAKNMSIPNYIMTHVID